MSGTTGSWDDPGLTNLTSGSTSFTVDPNAGITDPTGSGGITVLAGANTTYQPPTVDPYAQWGGQANYQNLQNGFNTQKQGIFDSINQWGDNTASRYQLDVNDSLNSIRNSQDALNRRGADNEAQRIQGTAGILGMVGRGVKSAGTYLGGRNAGSSSAPGEIAKAYGDVGRRQMSSVGNQYAAGNEQLGVDQGLLNQNADSSMARFKQQMDEQINGQVEQARVALTQLDADMQNASLPDRIAIEQEKNNIKNNLIAKLQGFDQQYRTGRQGITATDANQNRATAQSNLAQGQAPAEMFDFTDQAPMQMQNSGPSASGLPIFTNNKRRLA